MLTYTLELEKSHMLLILKEVQLHVKEVEWFFFNKAKYNCEQLLHIHDQYRDHCLEHESNPSPFF